LGIVQGDAIRNIYGDYTMRVPNASSMKMMYPSGGAIADEGIIISSTTTMQLASGSYQAHQYVVFDAKRTVPVANEIRPVNIAVRYIAKVRY